MNQRFVAILLFSLVCAAALCMGAQGGPLRVGAARVDVTPPPNPAQPPSGRYAHEKLYVRAIVVDNGATRAALIGADLAGLGEAVWVNASKQIAAELDCPVEHIIMSPTHTHSGRMPVLGGPRGAAGAPGGPSASASTGEIEARILDAVRQARAKLQPARMGFGRGAAYVNTNRDAIDPETRLWHQGPNPEGASDKTLAVIKFETPSGELIAAYANYAMHPINLYLTGITSADFPGAASRYVEEQYDDRAVVIWSQGASGDQNPLYLRPFNNALAVKRQAVLASGKAKTAQEVSALMMAGDPAANVPLDPKAADRLERWVESLGQVLGEEVIRVINDTRRTASEARIGGAQTMVTCPGRRRLDNAREGVPGRYEDGDPVNIRIGMLGIGTTALTTVNAELYNAIAQHVIRQSPAGDTLLVSLANGGANSGYIPTDAAFATYTFQVLGSRLKPGCAEKAIETGLLDLLHRYAD